jgi:hypothetical protein
MILIPDETDSLQLPFTGTAMLRNHQALKNSMFRAIIYNHLRVAIDSQECATWQDAVQWLSERTGNGRKWSEITIV